MHPSPVLTRRHALRLVGGAALAAVSALRLAGEASAGRSWCRYDPVIRVAGRVANVYVSTYVDAVVEATGATIVYVAVPPGAGGEVLDADPGFGHGYDVRFVERSELKATSKGVDIQVGAYVPAADTEPLRVEVVASNGKVRAKVEGTTNSPLLLLKVRI